MENLVLAEQREKGMDQCAVKATLDDNFVCPSGVVL